MKWPAYASPGWLATYATGIALWIATGVALGARALLIVACLGSVLVAYVCAWMHRYPGGDA